MSAATPTISALGPLQGRHSPPIGRQRAARRPSRPHSGPLTAFQTRGVPRVPPGIPQNARQSRFPTTADTADTPRGPPPRLPCATSNINPRPALISACRSGTT